jgi:hypothetical protein
MDLIGEMQAQDGGQGMIWGGAFAVRHDNWIYTWYQPRRDLPFPQMIEQMLRIYFFGILHGGAAAALVCGWRNAGG